jgi:type II secretory pathway component GspD/PulD (secretin)
VETRGITVWVLLASFGLSIICVGLAEAMITELPTLRAEKKVVCKIEDVNVKVLPKKSRIIITSNRPSEYSCFTLIEPHRFVVDFANAILVWPRKVIRVEGSVVARVRAAQHSLKPPRTRVVMDLTKAAVCDVEAKGNQVLVDVVNPSSVQEEAIIVSMDFKDADIGNVLRILGKKANLNIITDPSITGKVTVSLRNVTAKDALELILQVNGLFYQKTDNVLMVASQERLDTMGPKVMEPIKLDCLNAGVAKEALVGMKFKEENIHVDEGRNKLIVVDTSDNIRRMKECLADIDQLPLQVMLEAKIVEVSIDALKDFGLEWGGETPDVKKIIVNPVEAEDREVEFEDIFRFNAFKWNGMAVSTALNILEDEGKARILASPRLVTLNGQESNMLIGDRVPYTVTTIVEGAATTEIRYIDAGIQLSITPTITESGCIITKIKPEVSYIYGWKGDNPWIKTREAEAVVWLKDGEVAVLSGLLSEEEREKLSKVPVIGNIPGLGLLFRKERTDKVKTEIIITVTPRILTEEQSAKAAEEGQTRIKKAEEIFKKK